MQQREKDRKAAGSQRNKKSNQAEEQINLSDNSPHGTLTNSDRQALRAVKSQSKISNLFNNPFGKTQDKQDLLTEILTGYTSNGLPPLPGLIAIGRPQFDEQLFEIEAQWSDVVHNSGTFTKKEKDQQQRIWELLHTEIEYIKNMKVVIDLFMCPLINLQNEGVLNEIETEKVFSNVIDIHQINCEFWENYLSLILKEARKTHEKLNPSLLKEGFLKCEELLRPYTKYCLDQRSSQEYVRAKYQENELFQMFVTWAEGQKQAQRLRLPDLLIKPMQRLTRYKILLEAILKETTDEDHRDDLIHMIEKVERFVVQVNTVMHQRQEQARLSLIINRIESYDVVDTSSEEASKLIGEFSRLDLTCPVPGCGPQQKRHLLKEGPLKLKDSSKMDVYCFLFTDMLLVTKPTKRGDKVKVIKPPMRLDKIVVHLLREGSNLLLVYLNEYHMATAVYTFAGDTRVWVEQIKQAQEAYKEMRQLAMERPEHPLMYLQLGDDNDDEFGSVYNLRQLYDYSPDGSYLRLDSNGSSESFIPNLNISRTSSHETLTRLSLSEYSGQGHNQLCSSVSLDSGTDKTTPTPMTVRTRSMENGRSRSPRPPLVAMRRAAEGSYDDSELVLLSPGPSSHSPGRSPPDSPKLGYVTLEDGTQVCRVGSVKSRSGSVRLDSQSDSPRVSGAASASGTHRLLLLPNRPDIVPYVTDEQMKSKLNQRRSARHEKRYYTADAIQEMRKDMRDKDTSIHKRLSWNFGTVDISIDEKSASVLKGKTFSSDSLRSMPSSSGVSSTGSLHLSPESEAYEEYDPEMGAAAPVKYSHSDHEIQGRIVREPQTPPISVESDSKLSVQAKSVSKSMPDISEISIAAKGEEQGEVEPGEIPRTDDAQRRKLNHLQILRMKKQLLLNSTLEASEV